MDAFYASVEALDHPELRGKPVIVGGSARRGVVCAASYEARKFGVHSAQPMATAMRLCPHGVFLPVRMERYKEASDRIFEIFHRFTPLVEALGIDEAFLDVTGSTRLFGPPGEIAEKIRSAVRGETGLTVSAGVAGNKLVAKIASDLHKPNGLTVVPRGKEKEFLEPLPVGKLWGVGKVTQEALKELGVRTIGDLSRVPVEVLARKFGQHGILLHQLSHGVDDREVAPEREQKSIGREDTYDEDIVDMEVLKRELLSLATRVAARMRRHGFKGRTITLKVKYGDFTLITRDVTLNYATDDGGEIYRNALPLLAKTEAGKRPVRLLGLSLSHFVVPEEGAQLSLFAGPPEKKEKLNRAVDRIAEKFGRQGIRPAALLDEE
ncbi:MAG: DNA polymerase IV [Deltaproteobacteria bacterium]|nr:DNA polymerase IV [Deltaproteobacteria bacterium]